MGLERPDSSPLSSIHIDLDSPSITFTGTDGRAISFHPVDYLRRILAAATAPLPVSEEASEQTQEQLITLAGKLKTRPQQGYPDSKNNPTAHALFAAHIPEAKDAKLYFAVFHGLKVSNIVLNLPVESSVTVSGYPHEEPSPDKNDRLDVVKLDQYPSKPKRQ